MSKITVKKITKDCFEARYVHIGSYWIEHEDGEGMPISNEKLKEFKKAKDKEKWFCDNF